MKKCIFMYIMIILYLCTGISADAEEYNRTVDYRYNLRGYKDYYFDSDYTDWYTERDISFTDRNTDNFIFTRVSGSTTKAVTTTSVINGQDGTFYWSSSVVSGWSGTPPYLGHLYVDYVYMSPTSTVDTNYTISFTGIKHGTTTNETYYNRGTFTVELLGVSRLDTTSYSSIKTISYVNNPDSEDEYNYGDTVVITGEDGYNYAGYVLRVHIYCATTPYVYYCNGNTYKIYTLTNSLDNFTPDINYGEQLDNINGTLGSIYNAIVNMPTTIVNAINNVRTDIANLPSTIAAGIKHIFIYDNWEQDLREMADDIEIPMISQLTYDTAVIMDYFTSYTPKHDFNIKIPKLTRDSNNRLIFNGYMINVPFDLSYVLDFEINGVALLDAIRVVTSFGATIYIFMLTARFLYAVGIEIYDYVHPVIEEFIVESGVWGQEV